MRASSPHLLIRSSSLEETHRQGRASGASVATTCCGEVEGRAENDHPLPKFFFFLLSLYLIYKATSKLPYISKPRLSLKYTLTEFHRHIKDRGSVTDTHSGIQKHSWNRACIHPFITSSNILSGCYGAGTRQSTRGTERHSIRKKGTPETHDEIMSYHSTLPDLPKLESWTTLSVGESVGRWEFSCSHGCICWPSYTGEQLVLSTEMEYMHILWPSNSLLGLYPTEMHDMCT